MGKEQKSSEQEKLSDKPLQVKFPEWQLEELEEASRVSGKSKVELVRLATEAGLEYLKAVNFRVGKLAYEHSKTDREKL